MAIKTAIAATSAFLAKAAPTIKVAATVVGVGSAVASGVVGLRTARQEASDLKEQANLRKIESDIEATRIAKVRKTQRAQIAMSFIKGGVTLQGSPLFLLEEQEEEDIKEVKAVRTRGFALQRLGRKRADITKRRGRAALVGGVGQSVINAASLI